MPQFTVRVELHGASAEQYEILHERMKAAGFYRVVSGIDGTGAQGWWSLPSAEYDCSSNDTVYQVRDRVKIIGDSVKSGCWVLVTQVAERAWHTVKLHSSS